MKLPICILISVVCLVALAERPSRTPGLKPHATASGGGGSGFSPTNLNPSIWFDADTLIEGDNTALSTTSWTNRGNLAGRTEYISPVSTPTNFNSVINGHKAVRFTGNQYIGGNAWGSGTNVAALFIVGSWRAALPVTGFPGPVGILTNSLQQSSYIYLTTGTSDLTVEAGGEFHPSNPQTQNVFFMAFWTNSITTKFDEVQFGLRGGTFWTGDITTFMTFPSMPTTANISNLFYWAGTNYSITFP